MNVKTRKRKDRPLVRIADLPGDTRKWVALWAHACNKVDEQYRREVSLKWHKKYGELFAQAYDTAEFKLDIFNKNVFDIIGGCSDPDGRLGFPSDWAEQIVAPLKFDTVLMYGACILPGDYEENGKGIIEDPERFELASQARVPKCSEEELRDVDNDAGLLHELCRQVKRCPDLYNDHFYYMEVAEEKQRAALVHHIADAFTACASRSLSVGERELAKRYVLARDKVHGELMGHPATASTLKILKTALSDDFAALQTAVMLTRLPSWDKLKKAARK